MTLAATDVAHRRTPARMAVVKPGGARGKKQRDGGGCGKNCWQSTRLDVAGGAENLENLRSSYPHRREIKNKKVLGGEHSLLTEGCLDHARGILSVRYFINVRSVCAQLSMPSTLLVSSPKAATLRFTPL